MCKPLNFNADIRHFSEFFKRTFTRRNNTRKSHVLHQLSALRIIDGHLRACMQHQLGIVFLNDPHCAHVLNKHCIHMDARKQIQHVAQIVRFTLLDQRIDCHIDFFASFMRVFYGFMKPIRVKIACITARAKCCIP